MICSLTLSEAATDLITSLNQPSAFTEADLPRLDALARAAIEHAYSLVLLISLLPRDFTTPLAWSGHDTAVYLTESILESLSPPSTSFLTPEAYRYVCAAAWAALTDHAKETRAVSPSDTERTPRDRAHDET